MTQDDEVRLVMKAAIKLYYVKSEDWDTEKMAQEAMKMLTEARKAVAAAHEEEAAQLNKAPTTNGMSNGDLIAGLTEEAVNCSHYVQTDAVSHFGNYRKYRSEILARMERASPLPRIPDELRKLSDISTHGEWIAQEQIPGGYFYCIEHDERAIANNIRYAEAHFIIAAVNYIRAQIAKEDAV